MRPGRAAAAICLLLAVNAAGGRAAARREAGADEQVAFYRRQLARDPGHAVNRALLAESLLARFEQRGAPMDLRDARDTAARSLRRTPTYEGFRAAARVSAARHRFRETLTFIGKMLDCIPGDPVADGLGLTALVELGRYAEAEKRLAAARSLPEEANRLAAAVRLRWLTGQAKESRRLLERLRAWTGRQAPGGEMAAWCELELARQAAVADRHAEADWILRAALVRWPASWELRAALADLTLARGDVRGAAQRYRDLLRRKREPDWHGDLARCFRAMNRRQDVEREVGAAERGWSLLRSQGECTPLRPWATLYLDMGLRPDRALAMARLDHQIRPDVYADALLARALLANGRAAEAWKAARRSLRAGTPDPSLLETAAACASAAGEAKQAAELRSRAAALRET